MNEYARQERNSEPPQPQPVVCPECGEELGWQDDIFTVELGDCVAGCSLCLRRHNALEWYDAQHEGAGDWYAQDWAVD